MRISKLLKFCYLCLVLLLLSCAGDQKKEKERVEPIREVESELQEKIAQKVILFFGNSLTAGMGLEVEDAFPALIQKRLDTLKGKYKVVNAGLSGETTASGKNRLSWVLKQNVDIFVLELGANDGLRGIPIAETKKNLQEMINTVRSHNPEVKIVLLGMQIPPNMGQEYTKEFKLIYPELAKKNTISLVPFLLKDVAGIPELNQADGIHPTVEGQKILAKNVWEILQLIID